MYAQMKYTRLDTLDSRYGQALKLTSPVPVLNLNPQVSNPKMEFGLRTVTPLWF